MLLTLLFLLFVLFLTVWAIGNQRMEVRKEASEPAENFYQEVISLSDSQKSLSFTPIESVSASSASQDLSQTGIWQGRKVKIVPHDYFSDIFKNSLGISAIQSMTDGRLFLGTYNALAIKSPADEAWQDLISYQLNLPNYQTTNITFFAQTSIPDYEVYFGYERIIRMKNDGTFELVADPTDSLGLLRRVPIIPYFENDGVIAWRSTELYYLEKGSLRKWFTPLRPYCSQRDEILALFTDLKEQKTYGIIKEKYTTPACQLQAETHLYQFKFSSDPSVPLSATRLGKINNPEALTEAVVGQRQDQPLEKILYGFQNQQNFLYLLPFFYEDGREMTLVKERIEEESWPDIKMFAVDLRSDESDLLWFGASEVRGVYLGHNFDGSTPGTFVNTEDTTILANPYLNDLTVDYQGNLYVAHKYLGSQFNQALVTIFENPLLWPTPTPTPTPTPAPAILHGQVSLQRSGKSAPDPSWVTSLTVRVGEADYQLNTDQWGKFTLFGLVPALYDIRVKSNHALANLKKEVNLVAGENEINFGTLLEGDANNDNFISIIDFSILASNYNPDYDLQADFNQDGLVNILDFSLLATNFGKFGDIELD